MAEGQFFRLTGAFVVGVVSLLLALLLFALFLPAIMVFFTFLLPFIAGAVLVLIAVVVMWVLIYFFMMLGVGVYYAVKHPMAVNTNPAAPYGVSGVKESGKRSRGASSRARRVPKKGKNARRKAR